MNKPSESATFKPKVSDWKKRFEDFFDTLSLENEIIVEEYLSERISQAIHTAQIELLERIKELSLDELSKRIGEAVKTGDDMKAQKAGYADGVLHRLFANVKQELENNHEA